MKGKGFFLIAIGIVLGVLIPILVVDFVNWFYGYK
jgi:hypothetical protein